MTPFLGTSTNTPRIIAIEISGRQGSVAVALGEQLLAEKTLSPTLRHAVELMPALEQLCAQQGWIEKGGVQIDQVYLSLGPGSFTGLRIAVAVARTLAQAVGCKVVSVPSLEVIAHNAPADFPAVVPVLDAKRSQIFAACYQRADATGILRCTAAPALVDPANFLAQSVASARGGCVAILGEGVDYHRPALTHPKAVELDRTLWAAKAAVLHRLGWQKALRQEFADPKTLLPIYIRLPEAEEVWQKKHASA